MGSPTSAVSWIGTILLRQCKMSRLPPSTLLLLVAALLVLLLLVVPSTGEPKPGHMQHKYYKDQEATSFEEGGMGRVRSPQWSRRAREHARRCSAGRRAPGVQPAGMRGGVVRTMRLCSSSSAVIFCTLLQQW